MFALRRSRGEAIRVRRGPAHVDRRGCPLSAAVDASVIAARDLRVALVGLPNCGKTALFNCHRQPVKVANYPGVKVERLEGAFVVLASSLPGA